MNASDPRSVPVIEVYELTRLFGRFKAVDQISFSVGHGEIFGFLGPNGAGKSTTIRMLCGLLKSTSGTARVGGYDINQEPEQVRQSIGYMSQRFSLYRDLTVGENIAFFGGVYGLAGQRLRARSAGVVEMAGLGGMESRLAGTLSGAHQQRLALGCAILHQPPILFLDEPTSGVDPVSRRRFWDMIQGMAGEGVTILVTTHFMDEAEFCGRIGFINAGRLIALGTPAQLKRDSVREDLFELELETFREGTELLAAIEGVESVTYFGSRLHVFCRRGSHTRDSLTAAIRQKGIAVRALEPAIAGLEDVFVRLATRREGAG